MYVIRIFHSSQYSALIHGGLLGMMGILSEVVMQYCTLLIIESGSGSWTISKHYNQPSKKPKFDFQSFLTHSLPTTSILVVEGSKYRGNFRGP